MPKHVGLRSLAVGFPTTLRTNDYWRRKYPDVVADAENRSLAKLFSASQGQPDLFEMEMLPYLADPFRGTVERRVLGPGETSLKIELMAIRDALAAASMAPGDVDALLVASFVPDTIYPGNAAYLARELNLDAPAWCIESACNGALVALQSAVSLVRAGEYRNVLVAVSFTYSRIVRESDSLAWFMADGAGAFLVGEVPAGQGVLGLKLITTKETCGAFYLDPALDADGKPFLHWHAGDQAAGRVMRDRAADQIRASVASALDAARVSLKDVDFFIFNTPVAWFARFGARVLDVDPAKTISVYPRYGNIGSALTTTNLFHACHESLIRPNDLVLVFGIGSMSTAGAAIMRWGDVALGPLPPPSSSLQEPQ